MARRYSLICVLFNDPASLNSMIGAVAFLAIGTVMLFNAKPIANPTLVQELVIPSVFFVGALFALRWAYDNLTILRTGTDETATLLEYEYDPGGSKFNRFGQAYWDLKFNDGLQLMAQTVNPNGDVKNGDRIPVIVSANRRRCLIASAFSKSVPSSNAEEDEQ